MPVCYGLFSLVPLLKNNHNGFQFTTNYFLLLFFLLFLKYNVLNTGPQIMFIEILLVTLEWAKYEIIDIIFFFINMLLMLLVYKMDGHQYLVYYQIYI